MHVCQTSLTTFLMNLANLHAYGLSNVFDYISYEFSKVACIWYVCQKSLTTFLMNLANLHAYGLSNVFHYISYQLSKLPCIWFVKRLLLRFL